MMELGKEGEGKYAAEACLSEGSLPINDPKVTKLLFGKASGAAGCFCAKFAKARAVPVQACYWQSDSTAELVYAVLCFAELPL